MIPRLLAALAAFLSVITHLHLTVRSAGLTVTVDGSAPSGSGRDQRISSGASIFASFSRPFRQLNPDVVNVADARDFRLDLNVGYLARLPQKFT